MGNEQSTAKPTATSKEQPSKNKYRYAYVSNGEKVEINERINPFKELYISEDASPDQTKAALKKRLSSSNRQDRALASLAYYMITSQARLCFRKEANEFLITNEDIFLLTAIGHTQGVKDMVARDNGLIHAEDEFRHTPLYLAARGGFADLTTFFVDVAGCNIDHQQIHGSTALHAAAYFGQTEIMKFLLEKEASSTIKNQWNHTAEDEAANDKMKIIFKKYHSNTIAQLKDDFEHENIQYRERPIFYGTKDDTLGVEIILNDVVPNDWVTAWHGTRFKNLLSIVKYGLRPSGSFLPNGKVIRTPENHIQPGDMYLGVREWARAIFVSPSFHYAAHSAYAEKVFSEKKRYSVLVKVAFNPLVQHQEFNPTTNPKHISLQGEPICPEYRIDSQKDDIILRIEPDDQESNCEDSKVESQPIASNMMIQSIVFIKVAFLENVGKLQPQLNYSEIKNLLS